jgi:hypothetical protein
MENPRVSIVWNIFTKKMNSSPLIDSVKMFESNIKVFFRNYFVVLKYSLIHYISMMRHTTLKDSSNTFFFK